MELNFGKIKRNIFESYIKSINNKDDIKTILESFLKQVKSSEILKKEYIVFDNLSNKTFENKDSAYRYINENIQLLSKYNDEQIIKENEMLVSNILNELNILIDKYKNDEQSLCEDLNDLKNKLETNTLDESIESKIFDILIESYDGDVDILHGRKESIMEHLTTKKEIVKESEVKSDYPIEKVIEIATEKFNEKYSFLNEEEQGILKAFLNESEEDKKELYSKLIKESKKIVKRKLMENKELWEGGNENIELVNKLELVESKLKDLKYNKDCTIKEFVKLIKLRDNIKLS